MMAPGLPKQLPLRREMDYNIELELGAKPLARTPYRMSSSELEELQREIKELIDVRYIQPSKAPYGGTHSLLTKA